MKTARRCCAKDHQSSRKGYVLVTVIAFIAIASLVLTRLASTSMRMATFAAAEETAMRHRWAKTSIRRYCLDRPSDLLHRSKSDDLDRSIDLQPIAWKTLRFAGEKWTVIVADESAKLHLGNLVRQFGSETVDQVHQNLVASDATIKLTTSGDQFAMRNPKRWDEWFRSEGASVDGRDIARATQNLTLWGDGTLNFTAAKQSVVTAAWQILFGESPPDELAWIATKKALGGGPANVSSNLASGVWSGLGMSERDRKIAEKWFSTTSNCHSVWIFCDSDRSVPDSLYVEWGRGGAKDATGFQF